MKNRLLIPLFLAGLLMLLVGAVPALAASVGVANPYGKAGNSAVIVGQGDCAGFDHLELHLAVAGSGIWTQIGPDIAAAQANVGEIYNWDTSAVPAGSYDLKLEVYALGHVLNTTAIATVTIDHANPYVSTTLPRYNAVKVSPTNAISVYFSEQMDPASFLPSTLVLYGGGGKVSCSYTYDASTMAASIQPVSRLKDYTLYTLYMKKGLLDEAGNSVLNDVAISFRTGDTTRPRLTWLSPASRGRYDSVVDLKARIKDNVGLKKAVFYVDGSFVKILGRANSVYSGKWNTFGRRGGAHLFKVVALDYFGNSIIATRSFTVKPRLNDTAASPSRFSPDGNRVNDITRLKFKLNSPSLITAYVTQAGRVVRIIAKDRGYGAGAKDIVWNGKDEAGKRCHNGDYRYTIVAKNAGGNATSSGTVEIKVGLKLEIDGPVSIRIDLSERRLYLLSGTRVVSKYGIAIGMGGRFATPLGWRRVQRKEYWPTWYPPAWSSVKHPIPGGPNSPLGPRRLYLGDGYGIHGTNSSWSIGHAVSHGCIRMYNWAILEIFPVVPLGAPVHIVR